MQTGGDVHCGIGFNVHIERPHEIGILLLTFGEVVEEVFSAGGSASMHSLLDTLA
jgi:hypothetical protein